MNPFEQVRANVLRAIAACQDAGELPKTLDLERITVRRSARRWSWPSCLPPGCARPPTSRR